MASPKAWNLSEKEMEKDLEKALKLIGEMEVEFAEVILPRMDKVLELRDELRSLDCASECLGRLVLGRKLWLEKLEGNPSLLTTGPKTAIVNSEAFVAKLGSLYQNLVSISKDVLSPWHATNDNTTKLFFIMDEIEGARAKKRAEDEDRGTASTGESEAKKRRL
jgi:hypothetical protein